jgi:hypothetical protein
MGDSGKSSDHEGAGQTGSRMTVLLSHERLRGVPGQGAESER